MYQNVRGVASENHSHAWLDAIPELQDITDDIWEEALSRSEVVSFPAGEKLIQCGDTATHFIIVLKGVVRVYQTAESGKEICLYRVRGGQVCVLTLAKLLKAKNVCAQAVADENVRLLAMPVDYFNQLLSKSEQFRNYIMHAMADSLTEVMHLVSNVSFQRLELRLARLIGNISKSSASENLKVTHQEMANELGTTREVVSRILKEFENMGCIKLYRGKIEVLSEKRLQKLSG